MPLPTSRNKTYAPGDTPRSADLNDLQDWTGNLWRGHGDRVTPVLAASGPLLNGSFASNAIWWEASAQQLHVVPLPLKEGDRLKAIAATVEQTSGFDIELLVYVLNSAGSHSLIDASWDVFFSVAAGVQEHAVDGNDYTVGAGELLLVRFISGGAGDRLYKLAVTWDRPY